MTMKEKVFKRVFLVVIDSFGVGAEPDWAEYGDDPSLNTALHVIDDRPSPSFLWSRGLGYLLKEEPIKQPSVVAKLQELSKGKDSTTGHWEIAGLVMTTPFPTPMVFLQRLWRNLNVELARKHWETFQLQELK